MDHLATLLDLTADQKTQVQAVLEEEHAKMKEQRDQAQKDTLAKLTAILTSGQLKKFEVLMAERGPPGRPH
jgi:Spy/CpxP family protein refolding chaperone